MSEKNAEGLVEKKRVYTIDETAKILRIGRNAAYAAAGKEIPIIQIGRRKLVPAAWLEKTVSGETA